MHNIPSMTPESVHLALMRYGAAWTGQGLAVECGCWLGASCAALCKGLEQADYKHAVWCYDLWKATEQEVGKATRQGQPVKVGQNLEPLFRKNVQGATGIRLETRRGSLVHAGWWGQPIEIFLLDAAKSSPGFERVLDIFGPSFIPGATIVGLLDFYYARKIGRRPNQEEFVRAHEDSFEHLEDCRGASGAFFRYAGGMW